MLENQLLQLVRYFLLLINMQNYELQFIENQGDAHNIAEEIFDKISTTGVKDQKSQKDLIDKLFNKIFDNLNNHGSSPASKFMSGMILKDIIQSSLRPQSKLSKVFTVLLNHRLFKHLQYMCETIDPYKLLPQKGKIQFAADPVSGNNLMRLVLQIVKFLPFKFPKSKNEEPTAFKKTYNKLLEKKVTFPIEYKYITTAHVGLKNNQQNGTSNRQRKPQRQMVQAPVPPGKSQTSKQAQFNFLCNRLKTFIQTLQQEDQQQFLLKEINKMHGIIKVQLPKATNMSNEIAESTDSEFIARFFDISELMQKELELYERFIDRSRDLKSYTEELQKVGRRVFPGSAMSPKMTPVGKVQDNPKKSIKKTDSIYAKPVMDSKEQVQRVSKIQKSEIKPQVDTKVLNQLGKYFERVEQRSKSPISVGFKKIGQSLSRQKSKNNTMRSKVSPLSKSNFNKSINSLKQSKVAAIFTNPPNSNPPARHYEGLEIQQNEAINYLLTKIDKNQGHRRFKTANFKGKSSLFENQHLQIGYKSQAIYEEISGFRVLLKIELFFGNLSDSSIRNLSIDYKGDQNILLYANPRTIDNSIIKGEQNKVQLIVIPLKPEFPLLTAQVRYDIGDNTQRFQLILPNSALKFARFMELSRDDFLSRWSSAQLYKTTEFQLSHYLPPDTLIRWIPSLTELVSYTTFVSPGSKKDYELFTEVIMMQKYDALMKINVRPNLNVVIQLGLQQKIDEINSYFATFLQHLQQFMKQNK